MRRWQWSVSNEDDNDIYYDIMTSEFVGFKNKICFDKLATFYWKLFTSKANTF